MKQDRVTLVYILGAGRSGSTILSTILGSSNYIFNCADLMQFYEYGCSQKICNDGNTIFDSSFWSDVIKLYDPDGEIDYCVLSKDNHKIEHHRQFINNYFNLASGVKVKKFLNQQRRLIMSISKIANKSYIVDSSKYANRALLLSRLENIDAKFIYNVRDVRGVINSFSKNVQSSRTPLSALFYYLAANIMSELVYLKIPKSNKIRIKYEDLMLDSSNTLARVSEFLNLNFDDVHKLMEECGEVDVGPVIEGNRMVKNRRIQMFYDNEWQSKISSFNKVFYYILSLPLMVINKYKI